MGDSSARETERSGWLSPRTERWVAGLLLGVMGIAIGSAGVWLHRQGSLICRKLVEDLPTDQKRAPCRVIYRGLKDGEVQRIAHLKWEGETLRHSKVVGADGAVRTDISCSTTGRILLPLIHYREWLTISVLDNLEGHQPDMLAVLDTRIEEKIADPNRRVRGFDVDGDGELDQIQATIRREDGSGRVASHRYFDPGNGEAFRHVQIQRNANGLMVRRRVLASRTREPQVIDYVYECRGPDRAEPDDEPTPKG